MIVRKDIVLIAILLIPKLVSAQYMENPSFDGPSGIALTPPGWSPYDPGSTPDTEPLDCDDFQASEGDTYLTLVAHGSSSSKADILENCQVELTQLLQEGVCYTLSMDLASRDDLGHYIWGIGFIHYSAAVNLKVYGSNNTSDKGSLIAETGSVTNTEWETFTFTLKPASDLRYLLLEVDFDQDSDQNGNILVDNIVLSESQVESIVVINDTFKTTDLPLLIQASESSLYSWSPNTGLSCYNCRSPEVNSNVSRTYTCSIVSSVTGCPVNELFILSFEENPVLPGEFKIPNVFTPNGDGINDFFEIQGLPPYSALLVYDRSGKEMYSSDAYNNDWDGTDKDGNSLKQDNYWYILIPPGLGEKYKGYIYLKLK